MSTAIINCLYLQRTVSACTANSMVWFSVYKFGGNKSHRFHVSFLSHLKIYPNLFAVVNLYDVNLLISQPAFACKLLSISYSVLCPLFFLVKATPPSLLNIPYAFYFISLNFYHLHEPFVVPVPVPVPIPKLIKYPAPLTTIKSINEATAPAVFLDISCCPHHCLALLTLVHSSLHSCTFDNTIFVSSTSCTIL
jgi:hypothetical protein